MSFAAVESIVQALLYEGYLLYPYRRSALKNRQRWLFGRLLPREYGTAQGGEEAWQLQMECLIVGSDHTELEISVRFLQLADSEAEGRDATEIDPVERDVSLTANLEQITSVPLRTAFEFPPSIKGAVSLSASHACFGVSKLAVTIENLSPVIIDQHFDDVLTRALLSTLFLLRAKDGSFVSLLDPPEPYRAAAATCQNNGVWPVLAGPEAGRMMLAAPIILYDYPQVAPESPGDLFDGTEIDELLSLRIQTLTESEKREMSAFGERARTALERTDALSEDQLLQLHGRLCRTVSKPTDDNTKEPAHGFQPGDRVRLRPVRTADALDLLLSGQTATVVAVQHDFEDGVHLSVVMDDDPGRDFGEAGLPGHRFFYRPEEVERLS
jgi:hypothetical protein